MDNKYVPFDQEGLQEQLNTLEVFLRQEAVVALFKHLVVLNKDKDDTTDAIKLSLNDNDGLKLNRFLYLGCEIADYQSSRDWFSTNYFMAKNVPSIVELSKASHSQLVPVEIIRKAFESNLVPNPETLVFALALCCRQTKCESLRKAAYASLGRICTAPQHFLLFIKFATQLSRQKELNPDGKAKNGWGNGMRKAVNKWYLSKEPLELAKCVTRYKGRYGWKHKDIIKLSHPYTASPAKGAVFKYIMHGLAETKKYFEKNSAAEEVIAYLEKVEDFKHCEDEIRCAALLEKYELTLDHVPGHMLKSTKVWNSLISIMDLHTLLSNLQRIHNLGMLKDDTIAVKKIMKKITNKEKLIHDNIHPASILITLRNYQNGGKPMSMTEQRIKINAKKSLPIPPPPNPEIVASLTKALDLSFEYLRPIHEPTGLRYLITISISQDLLNSSVWRNGNVKAIEAACLLMLSILRCEENITVATTEFGAIHLLDIDKNTSFGEAMQTLRLRIDGSKYNIKRSVEWAITHKKEFDVFINIVDSLFFGNEDASEEFMTQYKEKLNLPSAKMINCCMCFYSCVKLKMDKNILTITGFDANIPKIIEAFTRHLF